MLTVPLGDVRVVIHKYLKDREGPRQEEFRRRIVSLSFLNTSMFDASSDAREEEEDIGCLGTVIFGRMPISDFSRDAVT